MYTLDMLQLLRHPEVLALEPYRVHCGKCLSWVTMNSMYHLTAFNTHIQRLCEKSGGNETLPRRRYEGVSSSGSLIITLSPFFLVLYQLIHLPSRLSVLTMLIQRKMKGQDIEKGRAAGPGTVQKENGKSSSATIHGLEE